MKHLLSVLAFLGILLCSSCEKTPEEIPVESVTLSQATAEMFIGETAQLKANVLPSNATDKTVTWASSKQSVATVSDNGLVTALAEGTSTITASAGSKSATCTIQVSKKVIEVTAVELDLNEAEIVEGESLTLIATVKPDDATDKTVTWDSSDKAIATVDDNGKVTAVKVGTATITAKAGGKQASCSITVAKRVIAVESITLNKSELALEKGDSETLVATVKPDDATDRSVTWSSSDDKVASVDQAGKITAVGGGEATISAKAGDKTATCKVTVTVPVESISLDNTSLTLEEGQSTTLVATVKPDDASDKTVSWSSSNTSVATVEQSGKVTAVSAGSAIITASAGNVSATCTVTVQQNVIAVTSVALNKTSLSLNVGESETLVATVKPDNATDKTVTWVSSNTTIATVTNGIVTAKNEGTATITATAGGKSTICTVTVTQPSSSGPEAVDLGLPSGIKWANCNLGAASPEEYGDYFAWGETEPYYSSQVPLTWKSGKMDGYDWSTYKWCNGSEATLTKYNNSSSYGTVDNKTEFKDYDYEDDAARQALGGKWRIPTDAEWTELMNNCTWTWVENYNGSGINGRMVKSKTNSNSIFLPAAGSRHGTLLGGVGRTGGYWSSSLSTDFPYYAWNVGFWNGGVVGSRNYRYFGFSVRPVYGDLISVTSVSLSQTSVSLSVGGSVDLTATVGPSNASNKTVAWSSSNTSVATVSSNGTVTAKAVGTATITVTTADGGKTATCSVTVNQSSSNVPEAVDLGLPSGIKWASFNLGASKPEEYGDYYAWGETEPKEDYSWSTYKWCNGSYSTLTKYNYDSNYGTVDNKTEFKDYDYEDDAARQALGGKWRVPTDAEWTELRDNCTWTWVENYNGSGINGRLVKSKTNSNSIFLPAAGYRYDTFLFAGSYGQYWSSSLSSVDPRGAWYVLFDSDRVSWYDGGRYDGMSVRPVSE